MKIYNLRGELTDISAEKEPMVSGANASQHKLSISGCEARGAPLVLCFFFSKLN